MLISKTNAERKKLLHVTSWTHEMLNTRMSLSLAFAILNYCNIYTTNQNKEELFLG